MILLKRTDSDNHDFQLLAEELEMELEKRYTGNESFAKLNTIHWLKHVIVAYDEEKAIGCGALRAYSDSTAEIKRMFVHEAGRRRGVASMILEELERWSLELGYIKCVLETGQNQPEAIRLYEKHNYQLIPNFGIYKDSEYSICFEKTLTPPEGLISQ